VLDAAAVGSTAANLGTASKTVIVTNAAAFTATGAAIVVPKDLLKDLGGNKVGQLTGTVVTDTKAPTVVGLPTYTTAGLTAATHDLGHTYAKVVFDAQVTITSKIAGAAGNLIQVKTLNGTSNPTCAKSGSGTIAAPTLLTVTVDLDGGAGAQSTDTNITAALNTGACSNFVTAVMTGTSADVTAAVGPLALAGGLNTALSLTSVATGVAANGYEIVITDNAGTGCTVTYAASTKTVTVAHDVGAADFCTPSAMKTAIETHSDTKGLFNIALGNNTRDVVAQDGTTAALGAFTGGTTRLTVSTTFSEAVTVDAVTDIKYNADGTDGDEVSYATVSGSGTTSVTTTYTLDGSTHQVNPAANTSEMLYAAAIPDLATNTLTSVTPLLSAP
jgi:hypothetical protein